MVGAQDSEDEDDSESESTDEDVFMPVNLCSAAVLGYLLWFRANEEVLYLWLSRRAQNELFNT